MAEWTHEESLAAGKACLEAALAYLRLGWSVLCLCPPDHVGVGRAHGRTCRDPKHWGKRPWGNDGRWKEFQERRPTEAEVRGWWRQVNGNVGVALGPVSGVVRVDVEGEAAWTRLAEVSGGDLPPTPEFTSGKPGGRGLLYGLPEGVEARTGVEGLADGELRIQGLGAQTVLPPSRHNLGPTYAWLPGRSPWECPVAPAPGWLLEKLSEGGQRHTDGSRYDLPEGEPIPEGRRKTTLASFAGTMRRRGIPAAAVQAALEVVNRDCCFPPLDQAGVEDVVRSAAKWEPDAYAHVTIVRHADAPGKNGTPVGSSAFGPPVPISQLRRVSEEAKWLWRGYLSCGGITLLSSLWKAGKTTLQSFLLKALEAPGFFCGTAVRAARVLYVTEEPESLWAERRDEVGLGDWIDVLVRPFAGKPDMKRWGEFLTYLQGVCAEKAYDLIVFDTIGNLWPVSDENDAAKVQAALMPLRAVSDTAAMLLNHHMRKGDGTEATAARGSGAFPAFVDTILELRRFTPADRQDSRRVLTGYGRYKETPAEVVLELTPTGYRCLGEKGDVRTAELCERLVPLLPPRVPGFTAKQLHAGWPEDAGERPGVNSLRHALREGAEKGLWTETGSGEGHDPFLYFRPPR